MNQPVTAEVFTGNGVVLLTLSFGGSPVLAKFAPDVAAELGRQLVVAATDLAPPEPEKKPEGDPPPPADKN